MDNREVKQGIPDEILNSLSKTTLKPALPDVLLGESIHFLSCLNQLTVGFLLPEDESI